MTARAFLPLCALLLLAGCATRISPPASAGQGAYVVSGSAGSIMATRHDVLTDMERHASSFCAGAGGKAEVVRVDTAAPELWRFPEGTLRFRCAKPAQEMASTGTGPTP